MCIFQDFLGFFGGGFGDLPGPFGVHLGSFRTLPFLGTFQDLSGPSVLFWGLLGSSGAFRDLPGPSGAFWDLPGPFGAFRVLPGPFGIFWDLLGFSGTFQDLSGLFYHLFTL